MSQSAPVKSRACRGLAEQGAELGSGAEPGKAASTASGARGTPSPESSRVWAPAQQGDLARSSCNFALLLPAARSPATSCTHPLSPLLPRCQDSAKVGQERPECAKVRGRNDPTLPHPRLESRNNSKTGERQSSRQNNTVPAHGSQPALGLGEKELTAGAEQGWVSWSLRQQRLLCCTTWLGLLSSQLT